MSIQEHYLLSEGPSGTLKTPNVVDNDGGGVFPSNLIVTVNRSNLLYGTGTFISTHK